MARKSKKSTSVAIEQPQESAPEVKPEAVKSPFDSMPQTYGADSELTRRIQSERAQEARLTQGDD